DRATLEGWVADGNTPQKLVWRARIVLMSAGGAGTMAIVRAARKSKRTVGRWQGRYLARGIGGQGGRQPPSPWPAGWRGSRAPGRLPYRNEDPTDEADRAE